MPFDAILIRGQGAEGLLRLARYALDVLAQLERHDDASARYLKRLRYLGDQIMMIYSSGQTETTFISAFFIFFHIGGRDEQEHCCHGWQYNKV